MSGRYDNRIIFKNRSEIYDKIFRERDVNLIRHFNTPQYSFPSVTQTQNLNTIQHLWTTGDRFYKLASQYYGLAEYWWVIAFFNQKPTEADVSLGEPIYIPLPLEKAVSYFNKS